MEREKMNRKSNPSRVRNEERREKILVKVERK